MSGGVFFYVQHLLGIGHTMRAAALTRAMRQAGLDVTYVAGGFEAIETDLAGAAVVRLPPVRATDASFKTLVDAGGAVIDDAWRRSRRKALLDAFHGADPDLLLIEMFPFGRWQFRFELLPLLDAAQGRCRIACSLRDILVSKTEPARIRAIVDLVDRYFEVVLVHGDPDFIPLDATFAAAADIADRIRYTGYVAPEAPSGPAAGGDGTGEVLVSAGGGAVGGMLMRAAFAARPLSSLADAPWRFLVGPNLPAADRAGLSPSPGVTIEAVRPDFPALLAAARLSISQAGYNTSMDLLRCRTRRLLVPFHTARETEQALRARRLAEKGLAELFDDRAPTPESLARAIGRAAKAPPPGDVDIDLDGTARSTAMLAALVRGHPGRAAGQARNMPL